MSENNLTQQPAADENAVQPSQPPSPVFVSPNPPRRRVGTITMALSLIAVGVLMIVRLFVPNFSASMIAQFSPLVLVFLGMEILITNKRVENGDFRYDGLSIFFVILLIGGSLLGVVGAEYLRWETERSSVQRRIENQLLDEGYAALRSAGFEGAELHWYVNLNYSRAFDTQADLAQISRDNSIWVDVNMNKKYKDQTEFSQDAVKLVNALLPVCEDLSGMTINSLNPPFSGIYEEGDQRYTVTVMSPRYSGASLDVIEKNLSLEYWEGNYFVSQYEYFDRLRAEEEEKRVQQGWEEAQRIEEEQNLLIEEQHIREADQQMETAEQPPAPETESDSSRSEKAA